MSFFRYVTPGRALAIASLMVLLLAGCGGGSGDGGTSGAGKVTIAPSTLTILPGKTQTFTASVSATSDQTVTWSVQEGSPGGTITTAGVYQAPGTPGVYHVIATSHHDTTKQATATVTVNAPPP